MKLKKIIALVLFCVILTLSLSSCAVIEAVMGGEKYTRITLDVGGQVEMLVGSDGKCETLTGLDSAGAIIIYGEDLEDESVKSAVKTVVKTAFNTGFLNTHPDYSPENEIIYTVSGEDGFARKMIVRNIEKAIKSVLESLDTEATVTEEAALDEDELQDFVEDELYKSGSALSGLDEYELLAMLKEMREMTEDLPTPEARALFAMGYEYTAKYIEEKIKEQVFRRNGGVYYIHEVGYEREIEAYYDAIGVAMSAYFDNLVDKDADLEVIKTELFDIYLQILLIKSDPNTYEEGYINDGFAALEELKESYKSAYSMKKMLAGNMFMQIYSAENDLSDVHFTYQTNVNMLNAMEAAQGEINANIASARSSYLNHFDKEYGECIEELEAELTDRKAEMINACGLS